jgi:hypothetical protein
VGSPTDSKAAALETTVQTDNPQTMNLPLPQASQGFIIGGSEFPEPLVYSFPATPACPAPIYFIISLWHRCSYTI